MSAIHSQRANCRNCYKCLRSCPVKAIHFSNGQAEVNAESCILCGICVDACPQHAKAVENQLPAVKQLLKSRPVAVSLAPSFLHAFGLSDAGRMVGALKALGFAHVSETALGAALVSDSVTQLALSEKMDTIITTCCPSANDLIEKYYPDLVDCMAPVVSPMVAHARLIKERLGGDTAVVFIGPCIAKMEEARDPRVEGSVDAVLTFETLKGWLEAEKISLDDAPSLPFDLADAGLDRLYPVEGGILENIRRRGVTGYQMLQVQGVSACMDLLAALREGSVTHCLIEINTCAGGCLGGPATGCERTGRFAGALHTRRFGAVEQPFIPPVEHNLPLGKVFMDRSRKQAMPTEEELRAILRKIGKETKLDELNCGSCGYSSCREKAIAVYQGKAELSMCLPHMYQTAQSLSNVVFDNTPNYILIVDRDMKVCDMNTAAREALGVSRSAAAGKYLFELMDTADAEFVLERHTTILDKKMTLSQPNKIVMVTLVYLPQKDSVMLILRDVTQEEQRAKELYQLRIDTMEMAQKVIDKQMVAAQEIASLLGETTAETKSTLTHLKNMMIGNEDRHGHDAL